MSASRAPLAALRPARRPQAERSAETRSRLIAAAIACLHRLGYSATTVTVVAEEAGVSRGAMTHQFPAKTDLMLAVVRAVFRLDSDQYQASAGGMSPVHWMRAPPPTIWNGGSPPARLAGMEIIVASP